ncbi:MAG: DUF3857 domain-containing protein [Candidatus Omnitrophica bacterium]|nr:DUF3857 domain-containing protein [Candidatus Omnitrophota bacterium]
MEKNKLKWLWLLICVAAASFAAALCLSIFLGWPGEKLVPYKDVPQNTQAEREWEQRNKDKSVVMLLQESKMEFTETEGFLEWHQVIRIQTDKAKGVGELKFEYSKNSERITELKAITHTRDGRVLRPSMIQDRNKVVEGNFYSDAREKVLTLPEAVPGSIIEVWLRRSSKLGLNKINQIIPLRYDCPIKFFRSEVSVPVKKQFRMLSRNTAIKPKISSVGGKLVYLWQQDYVDGYIKEKYSPPEGELTEEAIFSSFNSWDEVGSLFREKFDKNPKPTTKMVLAAQGLIAGKRTEIEKVNAILQYICSQLRYVSITDSRYFSEPRKASVIFEQKFGNCQDYTILAGVLLKAVGITSYPVLVCDYDKGNPADKLPGNYFNHVILGLLLDGKYYYADPQIFGYQLNEIPPQLSGAYIFVLNDKPFLSQLPFAPASVDKKDIRAKLSEDGSALVQEFQALARDDAVGYELQLKNNQQKEADITSSFTAPIGIKLIERKVVLQKDGSVNFDTVYNDNSFGRIAGEIIMFGLGPEALNWLPVEKKERELPFNFLGNGKSWLTRAAYDIPPGFEIVHIPENFELTNDLITFSRKYFTYNKNTITVLETMLVKPCRIPVSGYAKFISSLDSMVSACKDMICIQKQKSKPPVPSQEK